MVDYWFDPKQFIYFFIFLFLFLGGYLLIVHICLIIHFLKAQNTLIHLH